MDKLVCPFCESTNIDRFIGGANIGRFRGYICKDCGTTWFPGSK